MKQQQPFPLEEDISTLSYSAATAAASGEASNNSTVSSCNFNNNNNNNTTAAAADQNGPPIYQHYFAPPIHHSQPPPPPPPKKKRNLPGNPDPEAEVIAMSPKSLMATNRFVCEICNKGFQRDQNLQLHKRGHNLPWKLKQRESKEVKKKVYVCPVLSCVHHHPSRALGDLTGIKKHFCRKHGDKKWKCDKCSKRYAVQSDWKAHSKTCGTREYKCDCGTLFSRRDSFITHRAFCDALAAEESSRSNPPINDHMMIHSNIDIHHHQSQKLILNGQLKREEDDFSTNNNNPIRAGAEIPPWLAGPQALYDQLIGSTVVFHNDDRRMQNPNPRLGGGSTTTYQNPNPNTSATALLQKAAEMGSTMSSRKQQEEEGGGHVSANSGNNSNGGFGMNLSLREQGLSSLRNKAAAAAAAVDATPTPPCSSFLQEMMMMSSSSSGFDGSTFEDHHGLGLFSYYQDDMLDYKKLEDTTTTYFNHNHNQNQNHRIINNNHDNENDNVGMTRDFFGAKSLIKK